MDVLNAFRIFSINILKLDELIKTDVTNKVINQPIKVVTGLLPQGRNTRIVLEIPNDSPVEKDSIKVKSLFREITKYI
jgi:hypothetical protein